MPRPFDYATISVFYFDHLEVRQDRPQSWRIAFSNRLPPVRQRALFDRKQFETRLNVWPGTVVRLRRLMASDGPVVNIKTTWHGYDDVIREFAKRVVDTRWTAAASSVAWDRRSSGECRLIQLLPVPLLF
jgi:hypothetical protein